MCKIQTISWLATLLSLFGSYHLNRKNLKGFYLFTVANIFSILFAISIQNYSQILMFTIFVYFNIEGIKKWKADDLIKESI